MIIWVLQQLLLCRKALLAEDSPRQLAWALALGMMIGLVPKGNLLAVVLSLIVLSIRVNLPMALVSALVFSFLGMFLDPVTHRVGVFLLQLPTLKSLAAQLYHLPLVPWTSFNNTVVLGSLVLAAGLVYPAYRLALPGFTWLAERRRRKEEATLQASPPCGAQMAVGSPAGDLAARDTPSAVDTETGSAAMTQLGGIRPAERCYDARPASDPADHEPAFFASKPRCLP